MSKTQSNDHHTDESVCESSEPVTEQTVEPSDNASSEQAAELEKAQEQAKEYWERLLRKEAELQNAQKRAAQQVADARQYSVIPFATELLGALDALEQGLAAIEQADDAALKEGMELTQKMLLDAMAKFGVDVLDPMGQAFDPKEHEALSMQPSDEHAPNTVLAVIQKGYQLKSRLLRPARVIVVKA